MALQVGITGGIGSGKTTVCKIFETLGIPVYYSDERAKWLIENDRELIFGIKALLGEQAYDADGHYNRPYVAKQVFTDKAKLQALNGLVHPAVFKDSQSWQQSQLEASYSLKEAALIFESGNYRLLDKVIVVTAPRALRIERVVKRDGTSATAVEDRMNAQWPQEEKVKLADFLIHNDGKQPLIPQVIQIHRVLTNLSY